jgi:hypothetical protein
MKPVLFPWKKLICPFDKITLLLITGARENPKPGPEEK